MKIPKQYQQRNLHHKDSTTKLDLRAIYLPEFKDFDPLDFPWDEVADKKPVSEEFQIAKRSRSRLVLRFEKNQSAYFIKRIKARKLSNQISAAVLGSKAFREFEAALGFEQKGYLVPKPVFVARGPRNYWSFLVTESLQGDLVALDEYLRHHDLKDSMIERLADFTATLHQDSIYHDDYRSDHLFLRNNWSAESIRHTFTMIDLDGATFRKKPSEKKRIEAIDELFLSLMRIDLVEHQAKLFCDVYESGTEVKLNAKSIYKKAFQEYKDYHQKKRAN